MKKPERHSQEWKVQLFNEMVHIQLFFIPARTETYPDRVLVKDLFDEYQDWRRRQDKEPSQLSLQTFGKFLPKYLKRSTRRVHGELGKVVIGIRIRK